MSAGVVLHVAVGVVSDGDGNILLTKRLKHLHQGGLWEFPGGKVETGETVFEALRRELEEEVGITAVEAFPLIKISHDYGDRRVLLDVWKVTAFSGKAVPREGQTMQWVAPHRLGGLSFPAANRPIVKAVQLPDCYAILEGASAPEVMANCQSILDCGVKLMQLRVKSLPPQELSWVSAWVAEQCRKRGVVLLFNSDLPMLETFADGIHLTSRTLLASSSRPQGHAWVAASCHNLAELRQAEQLKLDFAVLAPVQATATHPGASPLGWEELSVLLSQVNLPVFAMGGLALEDLDKTRAAGAQGLAGIRAFLA